MKKIIAVLLSFMMLLSAVPAFAAGPVVWDNTKPNASDYTVGADGLYVEMNYAGSYTSYLLASEGRSNGKWYWELNTLAFGSGWFGVFNDTPYDSWPGSLPLIWRLNSIGAIEGDILGLAFDADNLIFTLYVNGEQQRQVSSGLEMYRELFYPCMSASSGGGGIVTANFGATPFAYDPPEGYLPYDNNSNPTPAYPSLTVLMEVGEELQFNVATSPTSPDSFHWNTSDSSLVASVSATGYVTALAPGDTQVWATSTDGTFSQYIPVKVIEADNGHGERRMVVDLQTGETVRLFMTDQESIVWRSMEPSVATVDSDGKVTAVSPGMVLITATFNNKTEAIYIRVN